MRVERSLSTSVKARTGLIDLGSPIIPSVREPPFAGIGVRKVLFTFHAIVRALITAPTTNIENITFSTAVKLRIIERILPCFAGCKSFTIV
jgi:hypothetical protein